MLTYSAFEDFRLLSQGDLETVALAVKKRMTKSPAAQVLIFSDSSGKQMDLDLSGSEKETLKRLKVFFTSEITSYQGPGRPKLGVVSREISLLPNHWEWLSTQTGGASATIRRLVDDKMKAPVSAREKIKNHQEVAYRFLIAIAGNLPNFEEATRSLYRRDKKHLKEHISGWPKDLQRHTLALTEEVFRGESK